MLSPIQADCSLSKTVSSQPPAYVASRVDGGAPLPEVEVEGVGPGGWLRSGRKRRSDVTEALMREAVVQHVVEGMRGELARDLMMEVVGGV
jgi:hypothetical protein